jgi:hypothetical protein
MKKLSLCLLKSFEHLLLVALTNGDVLFAHNLTGVTTITRPKSINLMGKCSQNAMILTRNRHQHLTYSYKYNCDGNKQTDKQAEETEDS